MSGRGDVNSDFAPQEYYEAAVPLLIDIKNHPAPDLPRRLRTLTRIKRSAEQ
jgi:hypothetical protein